MRYGTPYKGSKNSIAEWIVAHLPSAPCLVDLFAGGCAVTHAALLSGKFGRIIANDIGDAPQLFWDAIHGKYRDESRWISREDFFRLKDSDPYVRYVWSFGNNGRSYLYSRKTEDYKRALHEAIFFRDYERARGYGLDLSPIDGVEGIHGRYIAVRHLVLDGLRAQGLVEKRGSHYRLKSTGRGSESALSHKGLERLQGLQGLQRLEGLEISRRSYEAVGIPPDSVAYCDIPYRGTDAYVSGAFDHEAFYRWAETRPFPVFISEYSMPEGRFRRVASIPKAQRLNGKGSGKIVEEGLFVPVRQVDVVGLPADGQLELDFMSA